MRTTKFARVIVAAVVMVVIVGAAIAWALRGGTDGPEPATARNAPAPAPSTAGPTPPPGADITGPLDLLLIGVDTRVSIPDWPPHADAIMLLHIDEDLRGGYLYSLPRDLRVDVPAFARNGFPGGNHKITEAMTYGAKAPGKPTADVAQGYDLLTQTISAYAGIDADAGAVLTFGGLSRLTDALGGVTLTIDQRVVSQHRRPDGSARAPLPGGGGYVGPQATYLPGTRRLVGWQAIDYARQRYTAGGDYTRQRHQRQLVEALLTRAADDGLATDRVKFDSVIAALGDTLVFSGKRTAIEYAYALRHLTPSSLTLVGLPGRSVYFDGAYIGEELDATGRGFLRAVAVGEPGAYLSRHPELVNN